MLALLGRPRSMRIFQKVMGRPRKRKFHETSEDLSVGAPRPTPIAEPDRLDDTVLEAYPILDQTGFPGIGISSLTTNDSSDLIIPPDPMIPSNQTCACLSSMYLTLDNLRSMESFNFPSGLCCLRDALGTAELCVQCRVCPAQFLTSIQNVQLLGTLLLCLSERYNRILKTIDSDATEAAASCTLKTLAIDAHGSTTARHENIVNVASSNVPLVLELPPSEWKRMAKKVVQGEVHGTSDPERTSFMSIMSSLEARQDHWHKMEPTEDCPDPSRRGYDMHTKNDDPMCLRLAREAKKLVELFDFS